jgi:hypothetical protein
MNINHNRIMAATVVAVFSLAMLAGCGESGPAAPSGTYQSKLGPDQTFSLIFLGNNEMEAKISEGGRDESYKTSFVTSGDTIIMNIPEAERQPGRPASMTLERNGDALEMTVEGTTIRFVKL